MAGEKGERGRERIYFDNSCKREVKCVESFYLFLITVPAAMLVIRNLLHKFRMIQGIIPMPHYWHDLLPFLGTPSQVGENDRTPNNEIIKQIRLCRSHCKIFICIIITTNHCFNAFYLFVVIAIYFCTYFTAAVLSL